MWLQITFEGTSSELSVSFRPSVNDDDGAANQRGGVFVFKLLKLWKVLAAVCGAEHHLNTRGSRWTLNPQHFHVASISFTFVSIWCVWSPDGVPVETRFTEGTERVNESFKQIRWVLFNCWLWTWRHLLCLTLLYKFVLYINSIMYQFPVFLSCLHPCMYVMYGQVDGLFHWYLLLWQ